MNGEQALETLVEYFPRRLRRTGTPSTVIVSIFVGEEGISVHTKVWKSSGWEDVDLVARVVAGTLQFEPATMDGKPVAVWVNQPIVFGVSRR